jgi:hypothetical protein
MIVLGATACGIFTMRARDAVLSTALEDLSCANTVVTLDDDGSYLATGCGRTQHYVCERDLATAPSKPGAIAALGCRRASKRITDMRDAGLPD